MSTSAANQPRQPKGVPTGGQWRATARPEGPLVAQDQVRTAPQEAADDWWAEEDTLQTAPLGLGGERWSSFHVKAMSGNLPDGFDQWELANSKGRTVAHVAACYGHLPADFNRWELADKRGWTVAHEAAAYGHLPADFNRWELADKRGRTVAEVAAS
jgi:hypothetical protein